MGDLSKYEPITTKLKKLVIYGANRKQFDTYNMKDISKSE